MNYDKLNLMFDYTWRNNYMKIIIVIKVTFTLLRQTFHNNFGFLRQSHDDPEMFNAYPSTAKQAFRACLIKALI